jgi:tripartite-type tricarboxylate transporter receptor subunit TctC
MKILSTFLFKVFLTFHIAVIGLPALSQAQSYPNKTITMVVPFPPGGSTDSISRAVANQLSKQLGQSVVVDNRPGAGGLIGSDVVAKAAPDGYTILMMSSSIHSIGAALNKKAPFDYDKDFTPIIHVASAPHVLLVTKQIPVKNLNDLITFAKANPTTLNYSSAGNGTIMHLTGESFKASTGIQMQHVPYKGSSLSMPDLISGKVHILFDSIVSGLPHVKDGKLNILAIVSKKRSPLIPEVPTISEVGAQYGLTNFNSEVIWGIDGPKNLPAEIVNKLNTEINKALKSKELLQEFANFGADAGGGTPKFFETLVLNDRAQWAKIIKDQNITAE